MRRNRDGYLVPSIKELQRRCKNCTHYKVIKHVVGGDRRTYCVRCMLRLQHERGRVTYTKAVRREGFWDITIPWLLHSNLGRVVINR